MKLVTYLHDGAERVGLLSGDGSVVRPLPCPDLYSLIESGDWERIAGQAGEETPLERVTLLAPIPRPRQDMI